MSKLSRDIVRRDKALNLLDSVENESENSSLNILDHMTDILRDIKVENLDTLYKTSKKLSPVWETIGIVGRIASIEGLWTTPKKAIDEYLPENNKECLQNFCGQWAKTKKNLNADALDFLALLNHSNV